MIQQAVILVGGLGTRLGALTFDTPKPLLEVAGRPFITHLLDELARQQIREVVLLAGFRSEQVQRLHHPGIDISVVTEAEPLGTGGALRFARGHLHERFFFLNGDSFFDINLWDLAQADARVATLALRRVEDVSRFGPATLQGETITAFLERAPEPGPGLINGGVGVLSRQIVDRIAAEGAVSIEREVYPLLAAEGLLGGRVYDRPFLDIGVPSDFSRAQAWAPQVLTRGAVLFSSACLLRVDPRCSSPLSWRVDAFRAVKAVNDAGLFAFVAIDPPDAGDGRDTRSGLGEVHQRMNAELIACGAHADALVDGADLAQATSDLLARFSVDHSRMAMAVEPWPDGAVDPLQGFKPILVPMDGLGPALERVLATFSRPLP